MLEIAPKVSVVTNIDCDHMDFHGSLTNLKNSFIRFLNAPGRKGFNVICLDDENIRSILPKITTRVVSYGFHPEATYTAQGRRMHGDGTMSFEVHHKERGPLGVITMRFPGDHNILNSLATVAVSCELGLSFDNVVFALENFPGVHRRYELIYDDSVRRTTIIDDYAHHPSEILALLTAAREVYPQRRLRAVFQPHRYTRSKNLAQEFPQSFQLADEIILAPIYSAQEKPIAGIGVDYLNQFFARQYTDRRLVCLPELGQITEYLAESSRGDDLILTIGAGNIDATGRQLAAILGQRSGEAGASVDLARLREEMEGAGHTFSEAELESNA
jgi:UDP-N-acetylmuramate--alanine ligase